MAPTIRSVVVCPDQSTLQDVVEDPYATRKKKKKKERNGGGST
jgi:hypothetical protein